MSINWSFKPEDLDKLISELEKSITLKDNEIIQSEKIINKLLETLENRKQTIKNLNSKLEFAENEIHKLYQELENSSSKISSENSEIDQINQLIRKKASELNETILLKEKLRERYSLKEKDALFFNHLKNLLLQKGFFTLEDYKDVKNKLIK